MTTPCCKRGNLALAIGAYATAFLATPLLITCPQAMAAWQTRAMPGANYESPPECYSGSLPDRGGILGNYGACSINPSQEQFVLPGQNIHFDGSGGGDCDVVGTGGCSPACTGTKQCATNKHNNWTVYDWTVSDPVRFRIRKTWGWIDEFIWVEVFYDPVTYASGWVGVERAEVTDADDPDPSPKVATCNIQVVPPAGVDASAEVHHDTFITDLGWVEDLYDSVRNSYLADFDMGFYNPAGKASYEVGYWAQDFEDTACGCIPRVPDSQTSLYIFGLTPEDGQYLSIIDTWPKASDVLARPDNLKVVVDIRYAPYYYGPILGYVGVYDPAILGMSLVCSTPITMVVEGGTVDSKILGHEWGHGELCLGEPGIGFDMNIMGDGYFLSQLQCEGTNNPQKP